eukprot:3837179-Amphidinium_carterae.1
MLNILLHASQCIEKPICTHMYLKNEVETLCQELDTKSDTKDGKTTRIKQKSWNLATRVLRTAADPPQATPKAHWNVRNVVQGAN